MLPGLLFLCVFLAVSASATEGEAHEHEHERRFSLFSLVKPLGIATLCLVSVTFLTGLFRRKLGKKFLKVHAPLAITSVILGLAHGTLVFILFG
jgi:DMSO/TMAO reductase YedYZ heme-binding membrane subunit